MNAVVSLLLNNWDETSKKTILPSSPKFENPEQRDSYTRECFHANNVNSHCMSPNQKGNSFLFFSKEGIPNLEKS